MTTLIRNAAARNWPGSLPSRVAQLGCSETCSRTVRCPARAKITPDSELLLKALLIFNTLVAVSKFAFNPCQQNG